MNIELYVPMHCESCSESVRNALVGVAGVSSVETDIKEDRVLVVGDSKPSAVVDAIRRSGREASISGVGSTSGNLGSAISVLLDEAQGVSGVIRFVQLSDTLCFVDGWLQGLPIGAYNVDVHKFGDLSGEWKTVGASLWSLCSDLRVESAGERVSFTLEGKDWAVWQLIGRSLVVWDEKRVCGVVWSIVARSAGMKENPKTVCPCGPINTDAMEALTKCAL